MAFRRDSKVDVFQRQISALRHQLGGDHDLDRYALQTVEHFPAADREADRRSMFPDSSPSSHESPVALRDLVDLAEPRGHESSHNAVPALDNQTSIIAHTTSWNGNMESTGSLHVHGRVDGTLTACDDVFIAEEANVDASIKASSVTVAGHVRGSIHCSERFEVLPQGRVTGDVRAPVIVIHDGALLAGEIAMTPHPDAKSTLASSTVARAARGGD